MLISTFRPQPSFLDLYNIFYSKCIKALFCLSFPLFPSPSNAALWHKHHFLPSRSMQSLCKWRISSKAFLTDAGYKKWSVCYGGMCRILAPNRLTEDWSTPWSRLDYTEVSSRAWAIWSGPISEKKKSLKRKKICSSALLSPSLGSFLMPVSFRLCHMNCRDCFSLNNKSFFFIQLQRKTFLGWSTISSRYARNTQAETSAKAQKA